jgi:8-oxo-dGTP diphosphatase
VRALLVRHASAGERDEWEGEDRLRPLDKKGRRQAKALAETLADLRATRLLSSPYVRCVQTLEAAAARLGLPVEEREELAEGASAAEVESLLEELRGSVPALSTHGDVIEELLGPQLRCKKGAVWVLEEDGRDVRVDRYLPPA